MEFAVSFAPLRPADFFNFAGREGKGKACFLRDGKGQPVFSRGGVGRGGASIPVRYDQESSYGWCFGRLMPRF